METQVKPDGILMIVEDPESLGQPEETPLQIRAEENEHFRPTLLTMPEEAGNTSTWTEARGEEVSPSPALQPGAYLRLAVVQEGRGGSAVEEATRVLMEENEGREATACDARRGVATPTQPALERRQRLSEGGQIGLVPTHEKMTNTSDHLPSGVTLTPSILAGSGRKVYVPPPDPGHLEYVGVDSQSVGFWYDGGRNLYSCPALPGNPQRVPSISELSLVCKSMLQWSNKLKQLRQSVIEADSKLAQTIKDHFMPRVKSATQRQPKDPNHVQRLVPLEHLKQLAEAVRNKASATASTEIKPSPTLPSPFVSATVGGGVLVVPASTCHPIPVLPIFGSHFVFPSTPPQCLDKAISLPLTSAVAGSPLTKMGGGEGDSGDRQSITVEQGLALAQALFSTSGIMKTDLGQPIILSVPPLLRMTVTDPVRVDTMDFTSKSIEISGETPIRKVNVDELTDNQRVVLAAGSSEAGKGGGVACGPEAAPQVAVNPFSTASAISTTTQSTACHARAIADQHHPATVAASTAAEDSSLAELGELSQTHTSTEVMSAKMLLSLTEKEWRMSPVRSDHSSFRGSAATLPQPSVVGSVPGSSNPAESSALAVQQSKRTQRKQKPIASARQANPMTPTKPVGKARVRARKDGRGGGEGGEGVTSSPVVAGAAAAGAKRARKPGVSRKRVAKDTKHQQGLATPHIQGGVGGEDATNMTNMGSTHFNSKAPDQVLELGAQQSEIPVKEFVIETDSDSDTSSSGSTSDTGSSTEESSSETTSEGSHVDVEEEAFLGEDPFLMGRDIGRKGMARKGHVVKIPRHLLPEKLRNKSSRSAESEVDKLTQDIMADHPLDLATLYAHHQGTLDLSTLNEITQSSQPNSEEMLIDTGSRSKRTCVRVREQIHRLSKILEGENSQAPSPRSKGGRSQKRSGEVDGGSAAKRSRRSGYRNQFTHKRRKKRKKASEDEPLWQSARKNPSSSGLARVFVFSTALANRAAESVERGEYSNIIHFHQAQPKGPGFFRPVTESPDAGSWSPKEDVSYDAAKPGTAVKQRQSPNSTVRRSSVTSSQGADASREECDTQLSPASLPSRPLSRQGRRLRKQSSWGGGSTTHSPVTVDMAEGAGRTRNASPLPYKSPADSHDAFEQWGNSENERDGEDEGQRALDVEEQSEKREGRLEGDCGRHQDKKSNGKEHVTAKPNQKNQPETVAAATSAGFHQQAVNSRSEMDDRGSTGSPTVVQSANPSTAGSHDDVNYTICHGTPGSVAQGDISSPIPHTRGAQGQQPSEGPFSPRPHHPHLPRTVQPQMEMTELYSAGGQPGNWNPSNQYLPPGSGGYHPQLSGLSYHTHPMPTMQAHGGYPYPVPYAWGHLPPMHPAMGQQHHQLRTEDMVHMQQLGTHVGYIHHPPQPPPPPSMMEEGGGGSSVKEVPTSMFLPNPSSQPLPPPLTTDTLPPITSQASHTAPSPVHHSAQPTHGHHLPSGLPLQRHYQALPPEYFGHPGSHLIPYGFEGAGFQQMHMWPQSHAGGGQLPPPSVMHPGHMMASHGGWYPPHLVHSMVSGVEVHGGGGGGSGSDGGKLLGKKGGKHEGMQVVDVKLNSNGNNNKEGSEQLRRTEQLITSRSQGGECSPTVSVHSGALLLPVQQYHRLAFLKDDSSSSCLQTALCKGQLVPK